MAATRPAPAVDLPELDRSIDAAIGWLDREQQPDGSWVGMLESNQCIEAEWLLALHVLGIEDHPKLPGLIDCIRAAQREDGSWEVYYGAPSGDINATVECYAALRAHGVAADDTALARAREWILANGGLAATRVFTRYWLALIDEWPWEHTPNLPPELIFLPSWSPVNIYEFASWARATLLPLSVVSARRMKRPLEPGRRLDELFPDGRDRMNYDLPRKHGDIWELGFRAVDRVLHLYQDIGVAPGRSIAIRRCMDWIVRRQEADGAWSGIQPPWIYSLLALHCEGYPLDHPVLKRGLAALDAHWSYERDGVLRVQASESIVWDTMLAVLAMQDCGRSLAATPTMSSAIEWILAKQVRSGGDWQVKVRGVAPGGWPFERANTYYPDVDDTAVALIVLARARGEFHDTERIEEAIRLGRDWVMAMQSNNGGWAAFDKDNDNELLTRLPFCDFGEVLDPPSADVTAHVVEAFALLGLDARHPGVHKALAYLRAEQETDGSWFGRWGVNHIYGTAAVLPALAALGEDMQAENVRRAADWIVAHQNEDGGWGETCASYMDATLRGVGESTASQTGWALMALTAMRDSAYRPAMERGLRYLIDTQREDGTWDEPQYTGTGFPGYGIGARTELDEADASRRLHQSVELGRGFMINYNLYRHYFPLMAMGRVRAFLCR